MRTTILSVCLLGMCLRTAFSLNCQSCDLSSECNEVQSACAAGKDKCITVTATVNGAQQYRKGCATSEQCNGDCKMYLGLNDTVCTSACCNTDNCNAKPTTAPPTTTKAPTTTSPPTTTAAPTTEAATTAEATTQDATTPAETTAGVTTTEDAVTHTTPTEDEATTAEPTGNATVTNATATPQATGPAIAKAAVTRSSARAAIVNLWGFMSSVFFAGLVFVF